MTKSVNSLELRIKGTETVWPANTIDYARGIGTFYSFGLLVTVQLEEVDILA